MVKTSFRLSEDTLSALAEIADRCHNGNKTAALAEAVERYKRSLQPIEAVGWVQLRVNKAKCAKCGNPIDGPGFVQLRSDGSMDRAARCGKCAK